MADKTKTKTTAKSTKVKAVSNKSDKIDKVKAKVVTKVVTKNDITPYKEKIIRVTTDLLKQVSKKRVNVAGAVLELTDLLDSLGD